jgi:hypothetical protein
LRRRVVGYLKKEKGEGAGDGYVAAGIYLASPSSSVRVTRCEGRTCDAKHGRPARLSNLPACIVLAPGRLIVASVVKMKRAPLGIAASMHQVFWVR